MTLSFVAALPRRGLRLALPLAAAMASAAQAQAQGWGEPRRARDAHRERHWDREGHRGGYYRRPNLYYSAPPVMVHHPDHYRRPEPGISFQLPFFHR